MQSGFLRVAIDLAGANDDPQAGTDDTVTLRAESSPGLFADFTSTLASHEAASDDAVTYASAPVMAAASARVLDGGHLHATANNHAPELHQLYTSAFADSGTGDYSLNIDAPTDADGDTLTVTIDEVPLYGTVFYDDGGGPVQIFGGETLTPAQLALLRYDPAGAGEQGGGSLKYTVSDGVDSVHGQMDIHDVGEEEGLFGGLPSLFFSATGPAPASGPDMYVFADPSGPHPLPINFNVDTGSNAGQFGGYFHFNGAVYFFADLNDGTNPVVPGQLMAITEDAIGGPLEPYLAVNGAFNASVDAHFTIFGGNLYFIGANAPGGSPQLVELAPGPSVDSPNLSFLDATLPTLDHGGFTEMGGSLYFAGLTSSSASSDPLVPDLIKLDLDGTLTPISTRAVPSDSSAVGEDGGIFVFGNSIYFNAVSDVVGGETLFRLDAGSTTPVEVDPTGLVMFHVNGTNTAFHIFDGSLYFNENNPGAGNTLFKMDADGNVAALDFSGATLEGAGADGYGEMGGSLYFTAHTAATGTDLFKLDADGTLTAIDVNPGAGDSFAGENGGFAFFAGALYFFADDPNNGGATSLFRLDSGGVATPVDAGSDGAIGTSLISTGGDAHFFQFGDTLLLRAQTAEGNELVEIAPDGSVFVDDINDDPGGDSAPGLIGGFGYQGLTTLNGTNGNDMLIGCTELDILNGGPGNDLLNGRDLADILTGGDGADTFKFTVTDPFDFDLVTDYTFAAGDKLDVSVLLSGFNPGGGDVLASFVRLVSFDTGLILLVDQDGTDTSDDWTPAAFLEGVTSGPFLIATGTNGDFTVGADLAPTMLLSGGVPTAIKQVPLVLDAGLRVSDDSTFLIGADVFITNATYAGPQDTLSADATGTNITVTVLAGEIQLDGIDTIAHYQQVLRTVTYINTSSVPDTSDRDIEFTVDDGTSESHVVTETIHVKAVNVRPAMGGAGTSVGYTELAAAVVLDGSITASDTDDANLKGATVTISNAVAGDRLTINGATSGVLAGADGNIGFSFSGSTLTLTGSDSKADYQAALRLVKFDSTSNNPDVAGTNLQRTIDWQVTDPVNATSVVVHTTVAITAVDDPAVARNDAVTTSAATVLNGNLFASNGSGSDADPDGGTFSVVSVNGVAVSVGQTIQLASHANLTVNADGTFTYDPNGAFDTLAPSSSGAANIQGTDGFTYAITGGSTATVTVTVNGVDGPAAIYKGGSGTDNIIGSGPGGHLFDLTQGGSDTATGGAGDDGFKMGDTLDATDHINGGAGGGSNDQVQVEGNSYAGGLTLNSSLLSNIEVLAMVAGHNYKFTTADNLVGAGQNFTFWSATIAAPNFVDLDGSAETNGTFKFFLGQGNDIAKGGAGADRFYGEGGADTLTGGGGNDLFSYLGVSDSHGNANGTAYDIIKDFTAGADRFQLAGVAVSAVDGTVNGSLSDGSFETDLTGSFGSGTPNQLLAGHAVLFHVTGGGLSGHDFLIVNAHGTTGYSAGADYVFDVTGGSLGGLATTDFV